MKNGVEMEELVWGVKTFQKQDYITLEQLICIIIKCFLICSNLFLQNFPTVFAPRVNQFELVEQISIFTNQISINYSNSN